MNKYGSWDSVCSWENMKRNSEQEDQRAVTLQLYTCAKTAASLNA